jgi:dsRNA-specific ribonuclease
MMASKSDKTVLAATGIKALVGAVYYDGGYIAAKTVIGTLGLALFDKDGS